ncbi:hypothetical protein TNCV_2240491 [Trichonephila clavipes]|nr:hypothetical protein TNCV_2240491 [Trichonephila clavipes]
MEEIIRVANFGLYNHGQKKIAHQEGIVKTKRNFSYASFLVRSTDPNGGVDGWASKAANVIYIAISALSCRKMAPGSLCMSGNICGCRMSWTYYCAVMVLRINIKGAHTYTSRGRGLSL